MIKFALLKGPREIEYKLSLLVEQLSLEKKTAILNGVWFWVEHMPSLLVEKILHYVGFFSSKVKVYAWFLVRLRSKAQNFFFFLATLHSQKIVKEIAYILTSYQALLKAQFF